ncbi:hypothetical protein C4D60_Mb04t01150 [Musa balbisiana]|uniref:Uncharacterized protein n=1 Tax=Musa balbisiana TaxID=52838 RepID=A0A4S8K8U1_MUSBA|nr:hypothetical protein C4D60_Mb04t01150 [Musa balbisiana]
MSLSKVPPQKRECLTARHGKSMKSLTSLQQSRLGVMDAHSCFGLESMLFLEVKAERRDVVILIAVGTWEIRADLLPLLLLLHLELIDARPV